MSVVGTYNPRASTRDAARRQVDLLDRWETMSPRERTLWWPTLTTQEQDWCGEAFGYEIARGR